MPTRATSMPPTSATATASTNNAPPTAPIVAVPVSEASNSARSAATASAAGTAALDLPALQAESPRALAARAEQLPEKASAALQALARLPRARGVNLRAGRDIVWDRMVNQEAVLGYTRGQEPAQACASCKRQAGPFVKCVVVQGKLAGACTNCHYGSGSCRCSFRQNTPASSVTELKRTSKRNMGQRKAVMKPNRMQLLRKRAKLYCKLAETYPTHLV
ncbi:hypothetical protein FGG08_003754 [Glutinoglossum americanum]|uniref:Uncharacterized protein n=1 Tax=Glutinoglossum americanum TaxID=1670608 RepID=A0A9P8I717_9PEZI|nr:hypothetical protein FGG08_003754 [Glutinoglossum americanum]